MSLFLLSVPVPIVSQALLIDHVCHLSQAQPTPLLAQIINSFYPMTSIEEAEQSWEGMGGAGKVKGKDRPLLKGLTLAVPWFCLRLSTRCVESQGGQLILQPLFSLALLLPLLDLDLLLCQLFLATLPPASHWLRPINHHPVCPIPKLSGTPNVVMRLIHTSRKWPQPSFIVLN